jgi:ribosomal protein S18 acetylase RimI-like enzyme
MNLRPYDARDWPAVWSIIQPVFREGETYAYPLDISEGDARKSWTGGKKEIFVAEIPDAPGIVGTYYLKPNYDGPGAHVCNCGYVVSAKARGKGVASKMCEHSQAIAAARGYYAMQFNLVSDTNQGAVRLWKKLGFAIVGTLPGAFAHPTLGYVDAHVMYKVLDVADQQPAAAGGAARSR